MKKIIFIIAVNLIFISGFSQTYSISSQGNVSSCSGTLDLGTCTPGVTYIFTLCSDDISGGNTHISVSLNSYSIGSGNFCVYDGNSIGSPLIGCNASFQVPWAITATPANTSGCLTFEYTAGVGDVFSAIIQCNFQCQTIQAEIASTNPAATLIGGINYIDVCQGQQISFNGSASYQNTSYPQSNASSTFEWTFSDTTVIYGQTANWIPPTGNGYTVSLLVRDTMGCESINSIVYRIRVSRTPYFIGSNISPHVNCQGDTVFLSGTFSSSQWNSAPSVANIEDTTFLPDGSGVSYSTSINVAGFSFGQQLTNVNDLLGICLNIEHSYIGDLEMFIECPSGQSVQLEAQGGGSTFLGDANDASSTPGTGWEYCFTNNPTYGTLANSTAYAVPVSQGSALPSGSYASYQSLSGLIGCDLNGSWTITIIDNWAIDDGWIFGWSIEFNSNLQSLWDYQNTYISQIWTSNTGSGGSILSDNGTGNGTGTYVTGLSSQTVEPFYFTVIDNYGCSYDTTILEIVLPDTTTQCCLSPNINMVTTNQILCGNQIFLDAGTFSIPENVGIWTYYGPGAVTFLTGSVYDIQSLISIDVYGTYIFKWTEVNNNNSTCTDEDSVIITFLEQPVADAGADLHVCQLFSTLNGVQSVNGSIIEWISIPAGVLITDQYNDTSFVQVGSPGLYTFIITETYAYCVDYDTIIITFDDNLIISGNVLYNSSPLITNDVEIKLFNDNSGMFNLYNTFAILGNNLYSASCNEPGNYLIKAKVINQSAYPEALYTYYNGEYLWENAQILTLSCGDTVNADINLVQTTPFTTGNGKVSGTITYDATGDPVVDATFFIEDTTINHPFLQTSSDISGFYEFDNLPVGNFEILVDIPGIPLISTHLFSVTATDTLFENYDYYVDTVLFKETGVGIYADTSLISAIEFFTSLNEDFILYPNPVCDQLNIMINRSVQSEAEIKLINNQGEVLINRISPIEESGIITIPTANMPSGIYFLYLKVETEIFIKKIVISN